MVRKPKPEHHHWWPKGVSKFWKGDDGLTSMIRNAGHDEVRSNPSNFGSLRGGHHVKFNKMSDEPTPWDICFEDEFDKADASFPKVIEWLDTLDRAFFETPDDFRDRLIPQKVSDEQVELLMEGIVSLVVRSPRLRERAASAAELYRGPVAGKERNTIIGMNLRNFQKTLTENLGNYGKYAVIFSPNREFIFGDGFYTTIHTTGMAPHAPEVLVPITPNISVLYSMPARYRTHPKLVTLVLSREEASFFNFAVQVYAKEYLFYRSERPEIINEFRLNRHLRFSSSENPISELAREVCRGRSVEANI
jgi:hypothetical protein